MKARDTRQRNYMVRRARLIVEQHGLCPCGHDLLGEVFIDHDHNCCPTDRADRACGKCDRSAMHPACNTVIGRVKDNALRLRNLATYLEEQRVA